MGRSAPAHPLARRPPRENLGRYGQKGPVITEQRRRPTSPVPPPVPGEHCWILLRWNVMTPGQAHQLAQGKARVEPKESTLVGAQVGCYWCHQGYDKVAERCPAFDETPEQEPTPDEPAPLDPAPEEAVPVDPPTPPDAGPPTVELTRVPVIPDLAVEVDPLAQPMTETNLSSNQR